MSQFQRILVVGVLGSWVTGLSIAFIAPLVYMLVTDDDFPLGFTLGSGMTGAAVAIGGSIFFFLAGIVVMIREKGNTDRDR